MREKLKKLCKKLLKKAKKKVGVVIAIVTVVIACDEKNIHKKQTEIEKRQVELEQQQVELEQQQKEKDLLPMIKVNKKATILLGKYKYTEFELYDDENKIAGGKLKKINGVIIVKCRGIRIKTIWVKDAVYDVEVPFDSEQQQAVILYKEIESIEKKAVLLKNEIKNCLKILGKLHVNDFEVRVGIVATLEYSDSNNDIKEQTYIVYIEEAPYCEMIGNGDVHCDQYYLEYGKEDQGEEYTAVINEAVERILEECNKD